MAVRYFVADVAKAKAFYLDVLGFHSVEDWGPAISIVEKDGDRLWLSGPISSAARPMPDGSVPQPGGWNRIVVAVEDMDGAVAHLTESGVTFRNEVIKGPGGSQVLIEDPDGNPIEVFCAR